MSFNILKKHVDHTRHRILRSERKAVGSLSESRRPGSAADALKLLRASRAPLIVAIVGAIFLAYPPQTHEIYRAIAEEPMRYLWQLGLSLVVLCGTSIAIAFITRELLLERVLPPRPSILCRYLPIVCSAFVPLGLSVGLYLAGREAHLGTAPPQLIAKMPELQLLIQALDQSSANLTTAALILAIIVASVFMPGVGFSSLLPECSPRKAVRISHMVWFGLACLIFFTAFPVRGSQFFGPLSILFFAMVGFGALMAMLSRAGDRRQLPLLSGVVLLAVLLGVADLTDNHRIRLVETSRHTLPRAVDVFSDWYQSRVDRDYYSDRQTPYPVFIVAASGGGLYAAYHTATVLSRIQDRCPNFAQHIFTISGVSGGSLGAALFVNLAKQHAANVRHTDCSFALGTGLDQFERQSARFLDTDFLSPVLAATLFPDAVQNFFPALTSRFDRAHAFESTLARAWTKLYPYTVANPWARLFLDTLDTKTAVPALILNTTNVEHGFRVAITPFRIVDWGELGNIVPLSNVAEFHKLAELREADSSTARLRDISLATAVSLSARFPWVLPAGRFATQSEDLRLVDGGYVENSGSETVFDLVQGMERFYAQNSPIRSKFLPIDLHVIVITNLQILQRSGGLGLGDALSPIRAMLSARETRAVVALSRLWRFTELCAEYSECGSRVQGSSFLLDLFDFNLPLGWLLAPSTRKIVELHSGTAERAGTFLGGHNLDDREKFQRVGAYASSNDTTACKVIGILQAENGRRCE